MTLQCLVLLLLVETSTPTGLRISARPQAWDGWARLSVNRYHEVPTGSTDQTSRPQSCFSAYGSRCQVLIELAMLSMSSGGPGPVRLPSRLSSRGCFVSALPTPSPAGTPPGQITWDLLQPSHQPSLERGQPQHTCPCPLCMPHVKCTMSFVTGYRKQFRIRFIFLFVCESVTMCPTLNSRGPARVQMIACCHIFPEAFASLGHHLCPT